MAVSSSLTLLYETNLGTRNFLLVPRPGEIALPGSGQAESLLRGKYYFWQAAPQHAEVAVLLGGERAVRSPP